MLLENSQFEKLKCMETTSTYNYFHAALKKLWREYFSTREALSLEAGVSKATISDILNKKRRGSPEMQERIAAAFRKDLFEFYEIGKKIIEEQGQGNPKSKLDNVIDPQTKSKSGRPQKKKITPLNNDEKIRHFKDPDRAGNINFMLSELEKKDPEEYARVEGYIKNAYDRIAPKKRGKKSG
jgi:transcriptional regulator with XRE-family HTH domain